MDSRVPVVIMSVKPRIAQVCGKSSAIFCMKVGSSSNGQYTPESMQVGITIKLAIPDCCSNVLAVVAMTNPIPTKASIIAETRMNIGSGLPQLTSNSRFVASIKILN